MSAPNWTDMLGAVGGGIGGLAGVAAVVVAALAKRDSGKSAKDARRSADSSERSADAAEKSANEAAELNRIEQERRKEEREKRHEDLAPQLPGEISAKLRGGQATESLFGSITLSGKHSYRVHAEAIYKVGGKSLLSIEGSIIHPNQPAEFQIEQWPPGSKQPKVKEIRFRFWPPIEGDGVDVWTCDCGQPTDATLEGPGHWVRSVPVVWRRPSIRSLGM